MARKSKKPPKTDPTLAIAYLRASTSEQRLSPEAQKSAITAWASQEGVSVVSWHLDQGVSGTTRVDKRPKLQEALLALESSRAGLLVVAKRDRLARSVAVAAAVEQFVTEAGARIVAADGAGNEEGPEGEFLRVILDAFSQFELSKIQMRTRSALAVKKKRGEKLGGPPPFGFESVPTDRLNKDGEPVLALVPNPPEQEAIALIHQLRSEGLSIRKIAKELDDRGVPARGKHWHKTTVVSVLQMPLPSAHPGVGTTSVTGFSGA